MSTVHKTHMQI